MAERTVTHSGADGKSSRSEMMDVIEGNRAREINAELEGSGSTERVVHEPTPEVRRASGKDATDTDGDPEDVDPDDPDAVAAEAARVAAGGDKGGKKDPAEETTIYDFLGEDKLPTTKVKVKVDGVETELLVSDLVRDRQKTTAADKRLEEASITKKAADQVLADARTEAARITTEAAEAAKKGTKTDVIVDDEGKEKTGAPSGKDAITLAMSAIYDGHQDDAAGILDAEINRRVAEARGSGATVDEAQLAKKIKTDLSWDSEISEFNSTHKEIVSDPELSRMFQRHLNEEAKTSTTPKEAIEKATEKVTGWMTTVLGKAPAAAGDKGDLKVNKDELKNRKEEKTATDTVRSNSSIRSQAAEGADEVYDPSKVVKEMKEARGQSA